MNGTIRHLANMVQSSRGQKERSPGKQSKTYERSSDTVSEWKNPNLRLKRSEGYFCIVASARSAITKTFRLGQNTIEKAMFLSYLKYL